MRTTLAVASLAWLLSQGCGAAQTQSAGAQSPEAQSDAEYDLARDYFYKAEPRLALDHALKSVEHNDTNAKAWYFVSTVYLSFCSGLLELASPDCKLPAAEAAARRALEHERGFRDARNLLGQILILRKQYDEAIALLKPLTEDPSYQASYLAWGNYGWALVLRGRTRDGIAALQNAVAQPRFCVGYHRLGLAYEKLGQWTEAEDHFSKALEAPDPACKGLQEAWEGRGRVRLMRGKVKEGLDDLRQCEEISGSSESGKACLRMKASAPTRP